MKVYQQNNVVESLPGIILLSHGPFAVALVETAKMVFGDSENVAAFSFEEGDDVEEYRKTVVEGIQRFPEGSIIMLDLFGGSPCNQMLRYVQESGKVLEIVSGMNLPMLVNAFLARENMAGTDLSTDAVTNGKDGIMRVDVEGFLNDDDDDEE